VRWPDLRTTKPGVFFLVWICFADLMLCQPPPFCGCWESFPGALSLGRAQRRRDGAAAPARSARPRRVVWELGSVAVKLALEC